MRNSIVVLLLVSSMATAQPVCTIPGSDADNDGWGWENSMSCRVAPGPLSDVNDCRRAASSITERIQQGGMSLSDVLRLIDDVVALPFKCDM